MINTAQINIAAMDRFKRLIFQDRLGHAYLLVGPQDSGKTQTALSLAQLVNCEGQGIKPCGLCPPCRKIDSGNHPDVHVMGNDEGESIKIEEIRFLLGRAQLRAYEAKTKVFIIRNIEYMTTDAGNALLKTLEEPSPNTLMVLTTSVPENNLDTIKSRCHIVNFFPTSVNRIVQLLKDEGVKNEDARFLAVYSEGCLGKTRKLIKQEIITERHQVLDELLLNRNNDAFLKDLAQDDQATAQALRLLLSYFRDVLLFKSGVDPKELVHQDRLKELHTFAARSFEDLGLIIRQIVQTKKLVNDKLNVKMSLSLLREHIWGN